MKLNSTLAITAATVLFTGSMYSQETGTELPPDTLQNGLDLTIEIINSAEQALTGATVKIYQDNRFIAALNNSLQPDLNVTLKKDSYYIIQVEKPGYTSKSILISTADPDSGTTKDDHTSYEHALSISLDKKMSRGRDADPMIGIVYYDIQKDVYVGSPMLNDAADKKAIISQLENWLGH